MQDFQASHDAPLDAPEQSPQQAAAALGRLPSGEIRAALKQMPADEALQIASHLPGTATDEGTDTNAAVAGTIADLVVPATAILDSQRTAAQTVAYLVDNESITDESITDITCIFVVDDDRLVGVIGMRDIVLAKPGQHLAEIMTTEPLTFGVETPVREAARTALTHHQPVYPVVDDTRHLIGVVHGWRLFQRVVVEVSGQAGAQVGVSREEQVSTGLLDAFRMRHPGCR